MVCCDATYRLNWLNYPVFNVGLASPTGKFRKSLVVISSHEDHVSQAKILSFVKSLGINPSFLMGELFSAILKKILRLTFLLDKCLDLLQLNTKIIYNNPPPPTTNFQKGDKVTIY